MVAMAVPSRATSSVGSAPMMGEGRCSRVLSVGGYASGVESSDEAGAGVVVVMVSELSVVAEVRHGGGFMDKAPSVPGPETI